MNSFDKKIIFLGMSLCMNMAFARVDSAVRVCNQSDQSLEIVKTYAYQADTNNNHSNRQTLNLNTCANIDFWWEDNLLYSLKDDDLKFQIFNPGNGMLLGSFHLKPNWNYPVAYNQLVQWDVPGYFVLNEKSGKQFLLPSEIYAASGNTALYGLTSDEQLVTSLTPIQGLDVAKASAEFVDSKVNAITGTSNTGLIQIVQNIMPNTTKDLDLMLFQNLYIGYYCNVSDLASYPFWLLTPGSCTNAAAKINYPRSMWLDANTYLTMLDYATSNFKQNKMAFLANRYNSPRFDLTIDYSGNDDVLWWALSMLRYHQHNTDDQYSLNKASDIINKMINKHIDNVCGGGIYWDIQHTYKNAVTNELLIDALLELYQFTNNSKYLVLATQIHDWLFHTLLDKNGLFNDGVNINNNVCNINSQNSTKYTYNQGIILDGLGMFSKYTGNQLYLQEATDLIDSTISQLTTNSILTEQMGPSDANQAFKGIYMRHLGYLLEINPAIATNQVSNFINANYNAVINNVGNYNGGPMVGYVWGNATENDLTNPMNATTLTSGLDLINTKRILDSLPVVE